MVCRNKASLCRMSVDLACRAVMGVDGATCRGGRDCIGMFAAAFAGWPGPWAPAQAQWPPEDPRWCSFCTPTPPPGVAFHDPGMEPEDGVGLLRMGSWDRGHVSLPFRACVMHGNVVVCEGVYSRRPVEEDGCVRDQITRAVTAFSRHPAKGPFGVPSAPVDRVDRTHWVAATWMLDPPRAMMDVWHSSYGVVRVLRAWGVSCRLDGQVHQSDVPDLDPSSTAAAVSWGAARASCDAYPSELIPQVALALATEVLACADGVLSPSISHVGSRLVPGLVTTATACKQIGAAIKSLRTGSPAEVRRTASVDATPSSCVLDPQWTPPRHPPQVSRIRACLWALASSNGPTHGWGPDGVRITALGSGAKRGLQVKKGVASNNYGRGGATGVDAKELARWRSVAPWTVNCTFEPFRPTRHRGRDPFVVVTAKSVCAIWPCDRCREIGGWHPVGDGRILVERRGARPDPPTKKRGWQRKRRRLPKYGFLLKK